MGFLSSLTMSIRGKYVLPLFRLLKRLKMSNTKFVNVKTDITSQKLTFKENAVLSYLCSLSSKKYCYASNQHLCDTLGIEDRTMYRILSSLEGKNLIIRETKNEGGRYGKTRKIYVNPTVKKSYHV